MNRNWYGVILQTAWFPRPELCSLYPSPACYEMHGVSNELLDGQTNTSPALVQEQTHQPQT
jgi:hypothetical protein